MQLAIAAAAAECVLLPSPVLLAAVRAPDLVWLVDAILMVFLPPALAMAGLVRGRSASRPTSVQERANTALSARIGVFVLWFHALLVCAGALMFTELNRLLFLVVEALHLG